MKKMFVFFSMITIFGINAQEFELAEEVKYDRFKNPIIKVKIINNTKKTIDFIRFDLCYGTYNNLDYCWELQSRDTHINLRPGYNTIITIKGTLPKSYLKFSSIAPDYVHFTDDTVRDYQERD